MNEYLVRWKYGPNSLLNHMNVDTTWYHQIHRNKEEAVDHYVSLLKHTTPAMAATIEIFEMVKLIPGS